MTLKGWYAALLLGLLLAYECEAGRRSGATVARHDRGAPDPVDGDGGETDTPTDQPTEECTENIEIEDEITALKKRVNLLLTTLRRHHEESQSTDGEPAGSPAGIDRAAGDDCQQPCIKIYAPVCGSDGITYPNHCLFEIAQCMNNTLTVNEAGECTKDRAAGDECQKPCIRIYRPVCGSDGITYPNHCLFEIAQCLNNTLNQTTGVCIKDRAEGDNCQKPCIKIYAPVCGSDGITYPNHCLFEIAQCLNNTLTVTEAGECTKADPCDGVECDELTCPEDLQHTYEGNCCPECPQDWGLDPCELSGTCVEPTVLPEDCAVACVQIWAPVCGSDNKTYGNECEFEAAKCRDVTLTDFTQGECREIADPCDGVECDELPCPEDLQHTYEGNCCPECPQDWGVDPCELSGTCGEPQILPAVCVGLCVQVWEPVCGSDNKTYGNECEFEAAKCRDVTLTDFTQGECLEIADPCDGVECDELPCHEELQYTYHCCPECPQDWGLDPCHFSGTCGEPPKIPSILDILCVDVKCDELPCPEDLQHTYEGNCCPECPQDWGLDPCELSGTCVEPTVLPVTDIYDSCDGVECDELPCPEDLQHTYEGNCCPECPQDWGLDPCELSGTCGQQSSVPAALPVDCSDVGDGPSGKYLVFPLGAGETLAVYCDFDSPNGPWTVIQRRSTGSVDFYQRMEDYQRGFGNISEEFWLGLDNIYNFVSQDLYQLRIDLTNSKGVSKHATYSEFAISDESDSYRLTLGTYSGNARDSLSYHAGMQFTTRDADHDLSVNKNCAKFHRGAWWYRNCFRSNLNGRYRDPSKKHPDGIIWAFWRGYTESIPFVEMKIKRAV